MAAVIGLNGQAETFVSLNSTASNDDHLREVFQHVNKVVSSSDSCSVAKTCPLTDNDSSKSMADVIPDPAYVIKAAATGSGLKVFVNVCKKESVERPSSTKQKARGGRFGLSWTIPHTLTEQVINGSRYNQTYRVFDLQVHPDTCRMAETNSRFKNMLNELAVEAVTREFNIHLNVRKLQFPKIKYKAVQVLSRKKDVPMPLDSSGAGDEVSDKGNVRNVFKQQNIKLSVDSGKSDVPHQEKTKLHTSVHDDTVIDTNNNKFTAPKYTVTFSADKEVPVVNGVSFSQMLVVNIELPFVDSALVIDLYVFDKRLSLVSTGHVQYKLEIDLPCVIDVNYSFAKFTKSRKVLHVIMPALTSSSTCTSSVESSSVTAADPHEVLASKSDVNTDDVPTCAILPADTTCGQKVDLVSVSDEVEHAADKSVHCLTNVDSHVLQFSHRQDLETVSFDFCVKDVIPSSISVNFISDRMCKIEMDKGDSDGAVLSHICCFLKFDEACKCKDDGCTVDVTDVSVMLVIAKASQCHHMWNTFWTGLDTTNLEKRQFLSSGCIMKGIDSRDTGSCKTECKDDSVDDDKVVSDVEESTKSIEDKSSEIVVVHAKGVPKLHGILKQRTVSESSDDGARASVSGCDRQMSTTTGSEGDDNEYSTDNSAAPAVSGGRHILKKSVSFNDHIDRTLFQANQSVSSMHAALKNRRRRARKRDQKQEQREQQREQRRRRRSSGSFSLEESGDEQTTTHFHAEKHGENSQTSTQSSADTNDCHSSFHISSNKADCSYSNTISDGTEIANDKAFFSQNTLDCEFSGGDENEKPVWSELQKCKVASEETENGGCNYCDAFRTKNSLVDCGSDVANNDVQNTTNICDNTSSVHAFGNDENCESAMTRVNVMCASDVSVAGVNISQLTASCSPGDVGLLRSSCSKDSTVYCATCKNPLEKTAVLNLCCQFDLDVD